MCKITKACVKSPKNNITILYAVLLMVVLNQCLTDILPQAVEQAVPCLCGI